jgi:hypothetical protein
METHMTVIEQLSKASNIKEFETAIRMLPLGKLKDLRKATESCLKEDEAKPADQVDIGSFEVKGMTVLSPVLTSDSVSVNRKILAAINKEIRVRL